MIVPKGNIDTPKTNITVFLEVYIHNNTYNQKDGKKPCFFQYTKRQYENVNHSKILISRHNDSIRRRLT